MTRTLPQAVDVERSVLGALLIEKEAVPKVLQILKADDFYDTKNQKVYEAILLLDEQSEPIDAVTVVEELRRGKNFNPAEDPAYITELTMNVTSAANVEYHAHIVLEKSLLRRLIFSSSKVADKSFSNSEDVFDILEDLQQELIYVSNSLNRKQPKLLAELLPAVSENLAEAQRNGKGFGLGTGYRELDRYTGGFQRGDSIIVAARPSMGKTSFALSLAQNIAVNGCVAFFSIEMTEESVAQRLISMASRITFSKMRDGKLSDSEQIDMSRAITAISKHKIIIDDSPTLSVLELKSKIKQLQNEYDLSAVFVDYLGLIYSGKKKTENRTQEVGYISRQLKATAKETNLPLIVLAQLNRTLEARKDKRPNLADLRDSGEIEQDADMVLFLHRPEYYDATDRKGLAEVIVAKQRNGEVGMFNLTFIADCMRFENCFPEHKQTV